ncbi:hypothetical protein HDU93_002607, partial [Gonapodya sp. JEL0774]
MPSPTYTTHTTQTDALVAQKRAEIAARFAAIKAANANALKPAALSSSSSAAAPPAAPPAPPSTPTPPPLPTPVPTLTAAGIPVNTADIARRVQEAKEKILKMQQAKAAASATASIPTPVPASLSLPDENAAKGRGLGMDIHPSLRAALEGKEPSAAAKSGKSSSRGPPSRLNVPAAPFATTAANLRLAEKTHHLATTASKPAAPAAPKNPYLLPSSNTSARKSRPLSFVEPGTFIHQANKMRAQAQLEKLKKEIAETVKKTGMDAELELVGEGAIR